MEHTFNQKQREIFAKLLTQAKDRAEVNLESDSSLEGRVQAEVVQKLAKEQGVEPLIVKLRDLRKQVNEAEESLDALGFSCGADSISLRWSAPKALHNAVTTAKQAAREESKKVLKKYDLAILNVWASEDLASAKGIVEQLL